MKAMILAAGKGERLRPLTLATPKPLVPVSGKPLIIWHIERLARAGIKDIVINHAWLGQQLEDTLGCGKTWGTTITYSSETTSPGTGGGIKQALPLLGKEPFIVISADITTDYPFNRLKNKSLPGGKLGHLVLVNNPDHHIQGDYCLDNALIQQKSIRSQSLTFGSIALLNPDLFNSYSSPSFSIAEPFDQAIQQGQFTGELYTGYHCNVDTPERLRRVESDRKAGRINDNAS